MDTVRFAARAADPDGLLTSGDAAARLGVTATTVKRWAADGRLPCVRTPGGHRRFRRGDVERLRGGFSGPASAPETTARGWVDLLLHGSGVFDLLGRLAEARARRGSWAAVCDFLGAALVDLGRRWQAGTVTVVEEHGATETLHRALVRVMETLPRDPRAPVALLAMAEDDDHTLGLVMAELVLREAGWTTRWAGRSTPMDEVARHVRRGGVQLAALSGSPASTDAASLRRQSGVVSAACRDTGTALILGGSAPWPPDGSGGVRVAGFEAFREAILSLPARRG